MELQHQNEGSPLFGLNVDSLIKSHLSETAKWAKFLAIVGFIICGLIVVAGIFMMTLFNSMGRTPGLNPEFSVRSFGPAFIIIYILFAVLYFFPCLYLLRFANKMKRAVAAESQDDLTVSFQNLKGLFRYVGVLTIMVLSIYALAFLFGGFGALLSR